MPIDSLKSNTQPNLPNLRASISTQKKPEDYRKFMDGKFRPGRFIPESISLLLKFLVDDSLSWSRPVLVCFAGCFPLFSLICMYIHI